MRNTYPTAGLLSKYFVEVACKKCRAASAITTVNLSMRLAVGLGSFCTAGENSAPFLL
jgi:hypothetical protein